MRTVAATSGSNDAGGCCSWLRTGLEEDDDIRLGLQIYADIRKKRKGVQPQMSWTPKGEAAF
jgi:hypothetical protein